MKTKQRCEIYGVICPHILKFHSPKPEENPTYLNEMNREHFEAALSTIKEESKAKFGLQMVYKLSIRRNEATELTVSDVDFEKNEITIKGRIGTQIIKMPQDAATWLRSEIEKRDLHNGVRLAPINPESLQYTLNRALDKAGYANLYKKNQTMGLLRKMGKE